MLTNGMYWPCAMGRKPSRKLLERSIGMNSKHLRQSSNLSKLGLLEKAEEHKTVKEKTVSGEIFSLWSETELKKA